MEIGGGRFNRSPLLFDELALFNGVLPPELIYAHAKDALEDGRPYATCLRTLTVPPGPTTSKPEPGGREPRYYAPGFPTYAIVDGHPRAQSQLAQLESFPLPRYLPGHTLMPQMSWMGEGYLAGKAQPGQPTGTALNEATAVIHTELAQNWHYHYSVPGTTYPSASHPMVDVANAHPEWKTFAIGLWPQVRPVNHSEVFDTEDWDHMNASGITPGPRAFISTDYPTLSLEHFPNDGDVPITTNRKSPAAPLHTWRLDGKVQAKGFKTMLEALAPRKAAGALPIDHYNENGEVVSTYGLSTSIASTPQLSR